MKKRYTYELHYKDKQNNKKSNTFGSLQAVITCAKDALRSTQNKEITIKMRERE